MSEFRQDLERKSERFELAPGALDRLFERRRRKQRNQRIAAGAAALVVTAGMGLAIMGLRGLGTETKPAATPSIGPNRPFVPGDRRHLHGDASERRSTGS